LADGARHSEKVGEGTAHDSTVRAASDSRSRKTDMAESVWDLPHCPGSTHTSLH
jgi:hypothetical protein